MCTAKEPETEVVSALLVESVVPLQVVRMLSAAGPAGVPSETRYEAPCQQLVEIHLHRPEGDGEGYSLPLISHMLALLSWRPHCPISCAPHY